MNLNYWELMCWDAEGGGVGDGGGDGGATDGASSGDVQDAGPDDGGKAAQKAAGEDGGAKPVADSKTILGDQGSDDNPSPQFDWRQETINALGPDHAERAEKWLGRYNSFSEFVRANDALRSEMDKRVAVPGEDAPEEDVDKFYKRLGWPDSPDGYGDVQLPEGIEVSEELEAQAAHLHKFMHEARVPKQIAERLTKTYFEQAAADAERRMSDAQEQQAKGLEELRAEFGPDFEQNVNMARSLLNGQFSEETRKLLMTARLEDGRLIGSEPSVIKDLSKLARMFQEDGRRMQPLSDEDRGSLEAQIEQTRQKWLDKGVLPSDPEAHRELEPLYKKLSERKNLRGHGFSSRRAS
jgi:hypothetical protein